MGEAAMRRPAVRSLPPSGSSPRTQKKAIMHVPLGGYE